MVYRFCCVGGPFLSGCALSALVAAAVSAQPAKLPQVDDSYFQQGQQTLKRILAQQPNTNRAKNVILFIADGMGFATVTATRILEGQLRNLDGESNVLSFEAFPYLAVAKTYSHDGQVPDSASTAVAMMAGIKTKNDIINLDQSADLNDCEHQKAKGVTTLFEMAESIGMATGVVSTARVTHATPAAAYGQIANRGWESDADMPKEALLAGCVDLARQLVEMEQGDGLEVAMGGGRGNFLPEAAGDPEDDGRTGRRRDGKDLTQVWTERYGNTSAYVWTKEQFDQLDPQNIDHVLGLFDHSHMEYEADRPKDAAGEPSLAEMTAKAIDILSKDPEGYILMVEAGRVDHSHHAGSAYRALSDGIAFDIAIKTALKKIHLDETLVVATGDHSHTLTISGNPKRGNPIVGIVRDVDGEVVLAEDGKPYTTLSYANGPGAWAPAEGHLLTNVLRALAGRPDPSSVDTTDVDYVQQATVPLRSAKHAGEDVGIYAIGPWAHLFQGTVEQQYIFHVIDFALKLSTRAPVAAANARLTGSLDNLLDQREQQQSQPSPGAQP